MLKLKARNFRRFQETDPVIFLPGLTIVSGPNGAGKSTLVEVLVYALFGVKKGQAGDIQPDSSTGETGVECELIIDGQTVRVCRFNDRAELWINNTLQVQDISTSSRAANTQLRRLLGGLTREQFESTYVALQGDTAGLVEEKTKRDRDQRREIIESMLQLEVLRKAVENQERLRDRTLDEAKDKGKSCIDSLGLDSQANARLNQFANARNPERRAEHAQRFLANVRSAVMDREAEVTKAEEDVKQAQDTVRHWEEARNACIRQIKTKAEMLDRYEVLHTCYMGWTDKISVCNGQIQSVTNDMQQLGQRITEAEQHAEAAAEHARLAASIQQCQNRLACLELVKIHHETLVQRQDDLYKIDRELQGYTTVDQQCQEADGLATKAEAAWNVCQADPTTEAMRGWQQRKAGVDLQEKHITEALRALEDTTQDSACPTCGHAFTAHNRKERVQHLNFELTKTLPNLRTELATAKAVLNRRQAEWEQAKQAASKALHARQKEHQRVLLLVAKRDNLRQRHAEVKGELRKAQAAWSQLSEAQPYNPAEATQLETQVGALETRAKQTQEAANRYARLPQWHEQLVQKQYQLQELQQELTELTREQAAVGYNSAAHQSARAEHISAMHEASNVERKLTDANKELSACQSATERVREALACSMQLRDRFADVVKAFQREDRLFTFLSEFQKHFFTANVSRVVERATQLLRHAVTDQSILGIYFDDHDSLVYLDASHHPRSVARLSGGEKALVGLCLRIALAEQAQAITRTGKVHFLVLDEVLSSLDDERREAVQRIFEDVLHRGIFEHIIMITHLDAVKHGWRGATLEVHKIDSKTSKVIAGVSDPRDVELAESVEVD
jgi:exonuclease SbcC